MKIEIWSENLNSILEFEAIFDDDSGGFSIYAENDEINEWVCDVKRLSFKRFEKICTNFAETFKR